MKKVSIQADLSLTSADRELHLYNDPNGSLIINQKGNSESASLPIGKVVLNLKTIRKLLRTLDNPVHVLRNGQLLLSLESGKIAYLNQRFLLKRAWKFVRGK